MKKVVNTVLICYNLIQNLNLSVLIIKPEKENKEGGGGDSPRLDFFTMKLLIAENL